MTNKNAPTVEKSPKKNVLVLRTPIDINGEKVRELAYDFDALTGVDMKKIDKNVTVAKDGLVNTVPHVAGYDATENRYTFMQAVLRASPQYDVMDLERLTLPDLTAGAKLARLFIFTSAAGMPEASEEQ